MNYLPSLDYLRSLADIPIYGAGLVSLFELFKCGIGKSPIENTLFFIPVLIVVHNHYNTKLLMENYKKIR